VSEERQIIFFDGVCSLCNYFVDFVMARDPGHLFAFAPLQGETAKRMLPTAFREKLDTVVLWSGGEALERSDAAIRIIQQLGGAWRLLALLRIFPRFLRDFAYKLIAANRYRLFGRRETCRLPTAEEKSLFLD
jgi:predicted DCC family thiol-disulfide oxidoreductase YuxK